MDHESRLRRLLGELKRRGVLRAATIYGGVCFVLLELADVVLPALGLPPRALTFLVWTVAGGFPAVMVVAWFYDLTPDEAHDAPEAPPDTDWRRLGPGVAFAVVAVVAMASAATLLLRSSGAGPDPGRVLVTVFENRTGDPEMDGFAQMAADWVIQGLTRTGVVEVIPTSTAFISTYFHRAGVASGGQDPVVAVAEETGAGTVVSGTIYRTGDRVRVQTRIADARTGRVLAALDPVEGGTDGLYALAEEVRDRVAGALATILDPRLNAISGSGQAPPTFEAYRAYADGVEAFATMDFPRAIRGFRTAHALDSTFVEPLVWASLGYWMAGQPLVADSLAASADRRRHALLPIDALYLDFVRAVVVADVEGSVTVARRGFEQSGDALWQFLYAVSLSTANRPARSAELLAELDPRSSVLDGWSQYWGWRSGVLHRLGRYADERRAVREGVEQYPSSAEIRVYEARALIGEGDDVGLSAVVDAMVLAPPRGALAGVGELIWVSDELLAHGRPDAAREMAERAVARYEAGETTTGDRVAYGRALAAVGRLDDAEEVLRDAAAADPAAGHALGELGRVLAQAGDEAGARAIMARLEPLEFHPVSGRRQPVQQARIAAVLGEREQAVRLLTEALGNGAFYGTWLHDARAFRALDGYAPFERLRQPAG